VYLHGLLLQLSCGNSCRHSEYSSFISPLTHELLFRRKYTNKITLAQARPSICTHTHTQIRAQPHTTLYLAVADVQRLGGQGGKDETSYVGCKQDLLALAKPSDGGGFQHLVFVAMCCKKKKLQMAGAFSTWYLWLMCC
jgi:hypothetical protein